MHPEEDFEEETMEEDESELTMNKVEEEFIVSRKHGPKGCCNNF